MKELSIEEKAKAYDEALEKARQLYSYPTTKPFISDLQDLFPAFKESEDERIRNFLIDFIKVCSWTEKKDQGWPSREECIAWLEKQGEQKPKFRVGDTIKCKYDDRQFTVKSVDLEKGTYAYTKKGCGNDIDYADEAFELVEQKPTEWSEEDESMLTRCIGILGKCYMGKLPNKVEEELNWLKSLKDRVQPQTKQEWSEEDESHIRYLIECLEHCKKGVALTMTTSASQEYINWLKSLRPQSTWKPSDTEINILQGVKDGSFKSENVKVTLGNILEQLKKLRGE